MNRVWFICITLLFALSFPLGVVAEDTCVKCHSDSAVMAAAGSPQFVVTPDDVMTQSKMPATCVQCHKGNSSASDKRSAHSGLLSLNLADQKFAVFGRTAMPSEDTRFWQGLQPRGNNRATQLLPKKNTDGRLIDNPSYKVLLWHDKNPETLAFNPVIAMETCGLCHADIVRSFLQSPKGGGEGHTQSQYTTWTGAVGPQSCGLWTGVLRKPGQDQFTEGNMKSYNVHSTKPLTTPMAFREQRKCNQCHVGCLDCHLDVRNGSERAASGPHTFVKKPTVLSCYGGGRSLNCHAGPMERRRGDGYVRAEFTQTTSSQHTQLGSEIDVHMKKGLDCMACHVPNKSTGQHADLSRTVDCGQCHATVAHDHAKGPHKNVDCASCHSSRIGGYAFNFWSAVGPKGQENPLTRIQDYIIAPSVPLIVKNPRGIWIPMHIVPHLAGNVKAEEVILSDRLIFRNRPWVPINRRYFSNDAYAVTAVVPNLDDRDNTAMLWLNADRIAHATGASRQCESCHALSSQRIKVTFEGGSYKDVENGEYEIVADRNGLRVGAFRNTETGSIPKALEPIKDAWRLPGDFSLPEIRDAKKYKALKERYDKKQFDH
jgi:hypothetical protein